MSTPREPAVDPRELNIDPCGEGRTWGAFGPKINERCVQLWTIRRTPFETDQTPEQKCMVQKLVPRLRQLRCAEGERLHAVFTSDETKSRQPDAENIAVYNFGTRPFEGVTRALGFERSYAPASPPPDPLDSAPRYHHSWEVLPTDAPFKCWMRNAVVASWDAVPIDLDGDLGLAAWRALREYPDRIDVRGRLAPEEPFGVDVTLVAPAARQLPLVAAIKGLVDGPIAGLQRANTLGADVSSKLLRRRWGRPMDATTLAALVSAHSFPAVFPRAPFNKNGLDPCDELCVAGLARIEHGDEPAVFTGQVWRAE